MIDMADTNYKPVDGHPKMAERKCKVCGVIFAPPAPNRFLCDACLYAKNHRSLTIDVVCQQCGVKFRGGLRARYCPDCRAERAREADRRARQRKRDGTVRHLGSTDICVDCGKEYIVESGLQKRCKACAAIHDLEYSRATSREHSRAHREEYNAVSKRLREDSHVCPMCGKTFTSTNQRTKYCSEECQRESSRIQQKIADDKRRKK